MQLHSIKAAVCAIWITAVSTAGILGEVRSLSGWAVLLGLGALPPVVMMWRWNDPQPTLSESIQEGRR